MGPRITPSDETVATHAEQIAGGNLATASMTAAMQNRKLQSRSDGVEDCARARFFEVADTPGWRD